MTRPSRETFSPFICCMDCRRDTGGCGLKEYPLMLRDEVWLSITAETGGVGVLCRADMEQRLGRPLAAGDLKQRGSGKVAGR